MKTEKDLSVIIPFVGEYPQVLFTIQSIAQDLLYYPEIDFEIIAVDNYCGEVINQRDFIIKKAVSEIATVLNEKLGKEDFRMILKENMEVFRKSFEGIPNDGNKSGEAVRAASELNPWLKYMKMDEYLSHWECKRRACNIAKGKTFLFVDAHTVPARGSIPKMIMTYNREETGYREKGSFHMPLTYKILESRRLIYKLQVEEDFYGYSFKRLDETKKEPFEVPCMSTCGMMISKEVYWRLGGWPKGMTMYGGGENFINFSMAVCGLKKWIYPGATLFHHGDKRDYHYTYDGMLFNRMVAHYLFLGVYGLKKYSDGVGGNRSQKIDYINRIIDEYKDHRSIIRDATKIKMEEWLRGWYEKENNEGISK